jgi:NADH-quinone oxidoreductase subunit I
MKVGQYIRSIFTTVKSLWTGMTVTGKYFFSPGQIVTQKYPENRKKLQMFDGFKGEIIMPHDDNNQHRCTGCGICQINCPNGSIQVLVNKVDIGEGKTERVLDKHIYHLELCTFCGLCVKTCPSNALDYGKKFEHAVFDKSKLTKQLNKPGSSLNKEKK